MFSLTLLLLVVVAVLANSKYGKHHHHRAHHHNREHSRLDEKLGHNNRRGQLAQGEVQFALDVASVKAAAGGVGLGAPVSKNDSPDDFSKEAKFETTFELLKELATPPVASQLLPNNQSTAQEQDRRALLKYALIQHLRHGTEDARAARKERLWQDYQAWYLNHQDVVGLLDIGELERQLGRNHHGEFDENVVGDRNREAQKVDDK